MTSPVAKARPAYIYSRISSTRQTTGAGLERQAYDAEQYCKQNNLEVQELFAEVKSGFKGKHMEGSLGLFLDAIKQKHVPTNSVLVVESLDRLGREHTLDALSRFIDIVNNQVEIHEISTGVRYNKDDSHLLHIALAVMARAHNESKMKSIRSRDANARAIKKAREGQTIKAYTPVWIDINQKQERVLNDHAAVIKEAFDLYLAGTSLREIARLFNLKHKYPAAKRDNKLKITKGWTTARILSFIKSPAVIGIYEPKGQEPINDYFPAVVSLPTYMKAKEIRESKQVKKNKNTVVRSILSSMMKCSYCGSSYTCYTVKWNTKAGQQERVNAKCSARDHGSDCAGRAIPMEDLEAYVLKELPDIDIKQLNRDKFSTIDTFRAHVVWHKEQQTNLVDLVAVGNQAAKQKFFELQALIDKYQAIIDEADSQLIPDLNTKLLMNAQDETERRKIQTALLLMKLEVLIKSTGTNKAQIMLKAASEPLSLGEITWQRKKSS